MPGDLVLGYMFDCFSRQAVLTSTSKTSHRGIIWVVSRRTGICLGAAPSCSVMSVSSLLPSVWEDTVILVWVQDGSMQTPYRNDLTSGQRPRQDLSVGHSALGGPSQKGVHLLTQSGATWICMGKWPVCTNRGDFMHQCWELEARLQTVEISRPYLPIAHHLHNKK